MADKVTFDTANRLILCKTGITELDVKTDIYSAGKDEWLVDVNLNKFRFPMGAVGGQGLPGEKVLGTTFFLNWGWRIKPFEGNHVLRVNGNLYTDTGVSPYVTTVGDFQVMVESTVSSLVDSTVKQLPEIEYASFQGGVTVDKSSPYAGTEYPTGTPRRPVNNFIDAYAIAVERGFFNIYVCGTATLGDEADFENFAFHGESKTRTHLTIANEASVQNCNFYDMYLEGFLDGGNLINHCLIGNLNYVQGCIEQCVLSGSQITLMGNAIFLDCYSGDPQMGLPQININGGGRSLIMKNYNGVLQLQNSGGLGLELVELDLASGQILIHQDFLQGTIQVRGVGEVINSSLSGALIVDDTALTRTGIANKVWELMPEAAAEVTADKVWSHENALAMFSDLAFIREIEGGRWEIVNNQMIFYTSDNVTELARFTLTYDTNMNPVERVRV